jgi:hypothetical protein
MCWACIGAYNALDDVADLYVPISSDDGQTLVVIGPALSADDQQRVVAAYRNLLARFTGWRPAITQVGFADYAPGEDHTTWRTIPAPTTTYALGAAITVARR